MRLRPFKYAFLVMGWALICSISVHAQEGRAQVETEPVVKDAPRNEPDPILSSESESRNSNKVAPPIVSTKETARDSVQLNQVKFSKPVKAAEKEQKEEDPLSFNFLYYIIGKFKLSDIIE